MGAPSKRTQRGLSSRVRGNLIGERNAARLIRSILARAGDPINPVLGSASLRSIPARAGEPAFRLLRLLLKPVCPRACGGTIHGVNLRIKHPGLSPRVRGNHPQTTFYSYPIRSIPARAGEPRFWPISRWLIKVYPRACGGTMGGSPAPRSAELEESSPLGRGPRAERRREDGLNRPT